MFRRIVPVLTVATVLIATVPTAAVSERPAPTYHTDHRRALDSFYKAVFRYMELRQRQGPTP